MRKTILLLIAILIFSSISPFNRSYLAANISDPILESINIDKSEVTAGDTVNLSVKLADSTGINYIDAWYVAPVTNNDIHVNLSYNSETDRFEGSIPIRSISESGEYRLNRLTFYKTDNNLFDLQQSELFINGDFLVTGTDAAGLLKGINIDKNEAVAGDNVKMSVKLTDSTGIDYIDAWYVAPVTKYDIHVNLSYNSGTDSYEGSIPIRAISESGDYNLTRMTFYGSGNIVDLQQSELFQNGSFQVSGTTGEGFFQSISVDKQEAAAGENVTFRMKVNDAEGINYILLWYTSPISHKTIYVNLYYNSASGLFEGSLPVDLSFELGDYYTDRFTIYTSGIMYDFFEKDKLTNGPFSIIEDVTPPNAPFVNVVTDKSKILTGSTEAGSTVQVKVDGNVIGTTVAGQDGQFSVTIPVQPAGTQVAITATDKAGNESEATTVEVKVATSQAKPTVDSDITVDKVSVAPGDQVTVTVYASDSSSNITTAYIGYTLPITGKSVQYALVPSGDDPHKFTATIPINEQSESGLWKQTYVDLFDENENRGTYYNITGGDFSVYGTSADTEAPKVDSSVTVNNSSVTAGDQVTVTVYASDNSGSISTAYVGYTLPITGKSVQYALIPSSDDPHKFTATIPINEQSESGTWKQTYVDLFDGNENRGTYFNISGGDFSVYGTSADTTPPTVDSNITVNKITATVGDQVMVTVYASDDSGSVTTAYIGYKLPISGKNEQFPLIPSGDDPHKFTATIPISEQTESGVWKQTYVDLFDGNENRGTYFNLSGGDFSVYGTLAIDEIPPSIPTVNMVTDQSISVTGTSEVGAKIIVKAGTSVVGTEVTKADGTYSVSIGKQKAGTILTVIAEDPSGNVSDENSVTVKDVTVPSVPVVNAVTDQDTTVTGQAEAGTTVEVKVAGTVIGSTTADENGDFSITIPVQPAGTMLVITATDKAGNISEASTIVVKDVTSPAKPSVKEVTDQDTTVTGQAEAGSTVEVKVNGTLIATGKAAADGKFTITIPVQNEGTELGITATDQNGNTSELLKVIVSKVKLTGWVQENGIWYYYDQTSGEKKTGWFKEKWNWYFFDQTGAMKTGWIKSGSSWYYLKSSGAMATGWIKDGYRWYYLKGSGEMATGWIKDSSSWYYLNSNGAMAIGWLKIGRSWYYLKSSGIMATGWLKISGKWYYFNSNGTLK